MKYWLVKSEPSVYSFDQMLKDKTTFWSGVRNYQAANNMKAMKKGDQVFFYHSNDGKEIVGIVEVAKEYYPDHTDKDGKFGMVDLKAGKKLPKSVTLATMKTTPALKSMALIKQSRLSVTPISADEWKTIEKLAGL
jgi:predicted RNA-binding protein with PUA-like domain